MKLPPLILIAAATAALALPASAHDQIYFTTLSGAAEIPVNASPGTGSATFTVDLDLLTMRVQVTFANLIGTTTASHIHCCTTTPGSANVGVATVLPTFTGFPLGVTGGTYDHTFDMSLASSYNPAFVTAQGGVSNAFNALLAGMDTRNAYFNLHTTSFPGGEIRGLLAPVVAAVPEPQTYALLGAGLGLLAWVARRRRSA
ncbi:MAG: CHRD domain-containing protein [Pseudomonadota bacterium]